MKILFRLFFYIYWPAEKCKPVKHRIRSVFKPTTIASKAWLPPTGQHSSVHVNSGLLSNNNESVLDNWAMSRCGANV